MTESEEFEYWCAEYRDNFNIASSETLRLLIGMCENRNPFALSFATDVIENKRKLQDTSPDLVELLESNREVGYISSSFNPDDLDGEQWGRLIGAIEHDERTVEDFPTSALQPEATYPSNWDQIATDLKNRRDWKCEECGFSYLGSALIQVHHIDQDKSNNEISNLQVLCAKCHGLKHGTSTLWPMGISHEDRIRLEQHHVNGFSRRKQPN